MKAILDALNRSRPVPQIQTLVPVAAETSVEESKTVETPRTVPDHASQVQDLARQYVEQGWVLVPIDKGSKGPKVKNWNRREQCITSTEQCGRIVHGVGLAHAYAGTCAVDVDDLDVARAWLQGHGVDLQGLLDAPDAVRITSGRPNRVKLLYRLPDGVEALPSKQLKAEGFELRCATAEGLTMQDVLPPSVHPDTGQPYAWAYGDDMIAHWSSPPVLPPEILALWRSLLKPAQIEAAAKPPRGLDEAGIRKVLEHQDPDAGYSDWLGVGMALHHETEGAEVGLDLWDEWSSTSQKYKGREDLAQHWASFGRTGGPLKTMAGLMARMPLSADEFEDLTLNEEPPHRFQFLPADQFMQAKPATWIIKGLLPQAGLAVVFGESGSGKSFLVTDMALAITRGVEWRGKRVRQGAVAYVCAEGVSGFRNRLQAYRLRVSQDLGPFFVLGDAPNIVDPKVVEALICALKSLGSLSVVVVDTFAQVTPGANENSGEDMGKALAHCRRIHAATGALVLLVHHSGKDATRGARGWSGLKAAADAELEVMRDDDRRAVRVSKQKDGEDGEELGFRLVPVLLGLDEDGEDITSCVVEHTDAPAPLRKSRVKLGSTEKTVLRTLEDMLGHGREVLHAHLIDAAVQQIPRGDAIKDKRRENVMRAITNLQKKARIVIEGAGVLLPSDPSFEAI